MDNKHDSLHFAEQVSKRMKQDRLLEQLIQSKTLSGTPKRKRKINWDAVATACFIPFFAALLIFWLFIGGSR